VLKLLLKFVQNEKKNTAILTGRDLRKIVVPPFSRRVIFHKDWLADYELLMIFCCCRFRDGCMRACFFSAGSEPVWKLDFRRGNISYFRNTERDILHFLVSSDLTTYSIQTRARDIFEN